MSRWVSPGAPAVLRVAAREEPKIKRYLTLIADTTDLSTMETKLENNHYDTVEAFVLDCQLIFSNCRKYNGDDNTYTVQANKLERALDKILKKRLPPGA